MVGSLISEMKKNGKEKEKGKRTSEKKIRKQKDKKRERKKEKKKDKKRKKEREKEKEDSKLAKNKEKKGTGLSPILESQRTNNSSSKSSVIIQSKYDPKSGKSSQNEVSASGKTRIQKHDNQVINFDSRFRNKSKPNPNEKNSFKDPKSIVHLDGTESKIKPNMSKHLFNLDKDKYKFRKSDKTVQDYTRDHQKVRTSITFPVPVREEIGIIDKNLNSNIETTRTRTQGPIPLQGERIKTEQMQYSLLQNLGYGNNLMMNPPPSHVQSNPHHNPIGGPQGNFPGRTQYLGNMAQMGGRYPSMQMSGYYPNYAQNMMTHANYVNYLHMYEGQYMMPNMSQYPNNMVHPQNVFEKQQMLQKQQEMGTQKVKMESLGLPKGGLDKDKEKEYQYLRNQNYGVSRFSGQGKSENQMFRQGGMGRSQMMGNGETRNGEGSVVYGNGGQIAFVPNSRNFHQNSQNPQNVYQVQQNQGNQGGQLRQDGRLLRGVTREGGNNPVQNQKLGGQKIRGKRDEGPSDNKERKARK